jgi:phenylpropionate dioxygenase-like ring-hydroxylating dioxygenase large terminal subunit
MCSISLHAKDHDLYGSYMLQLSSTFIRSITTTMMRSALHYLGFGVDTPAVDETTIRALPSSWYTSQEMYELERRAIFSKKWQLITHSLRLGVPGDWIRYDVAGFEFVLCRDRQGIINGFHNICRHRAFPLVNEDHGRASIFACKYHGWSYGLKGTLAKAPRYQDIPDFDKNQNNLLPIHVHIDRQGFIWVNLDARNPPEVAWKDDFEGVDKQSRLAEFNFSDFHFDHSWDMDGEFNWKILADNYNECYHCITAHPDVPSLADLEAYSVDTKGDAILHFANPDPETLAPGLKIASTFYFPNASMTVS